MAKLVDVYTSDKERVMQRRQIPLVINENLAMILDLNSASVTYQMPQVKGRDLEEFMQKHKSLTRDEVNSALKVTYPEILKVINETIPCVGCRRSVEKLFYHLVNSGHPTLDPLVITVDGFLTIREEKVDNPHSLASFLHGHRCMLRCLVDSQPRSKKSRRCGMHSLEGGRARAACSWRTAWEAMHAPCREEVTLVHFDSLQDALDNYLRKHRFCSECKTKVLRAYQLLTEEAEPQKEKGYVGVLYAGIKRCLLDKHLHLPANTDYVTNLIMRAEPELMGNHRERHAKTLEIAQEEVMICLGICVYERLHRISVRLKEEEDTCQMLTAAGVEALYRNFDTSVELKAGVSKLELLYKELTQQEAQMQHRKEQKKLRKRKKKERLAAKTEADEKCECTECVIDKEQSLPQIKLENNNKNRRYSVDSSCNSCQENEGSKLPHSKHKDKQGNWSSSEQSHDCGYSSETNNGCCGTVSGSCSLECSPEGSEVACSEGFCNHEVGECSPEPSKDHSLFKTSTDGFRLTLQEMLLDSCSSDEERDEVSYIPIDDVIAFKSRMNVAEKRQELRQALRDDFAQLLIREKCGTPVQGLGQN